MQCVNLEIRKAIRDKKQISPLSLECRHVALYQTIIPLIFMQTCRDIIFVESFDKFCVNMVVLESLGGAQGESS